MSQKVGSLEIEIRAGVARLQEDFSKAKGEVNSSMKSIQKSVTEQMKGVQESLRSVKDMAEAMGIAMLGEKLVEAAKQAGEFGDQIQHAMQKTGMGAQTIQELGFAAHMSDVNFQSLSVGLEHLSRSMLMAQQGSLQSASAFQSVGLSAAQLKDMKLDDVLRVVADKFHGTRDGANKTALAMQLFGRSGAELIPMLDQGSSGLNALKEKAKQLGIVMSDEAVKQSAEFADKLKELSAKTQATSRNMMGELMPALNKIMDAFTKGSADGGILKEMMRQVGESAVWLTGFVVKLSATMEALGKTIAMVAAVVAHPLSAKSIFKDWESDVDALQAKTNKFLADLNAAPQKGASSGAEGATGTGTLAVHRTSGGSKSNMSEYEQRLASAKVYYQQTNDLRQYSKQQEIQYWQDVLDNENVSANERLAIERKLSTLRLAQMKSDASDKMKLSEESIGADKQAALNEVAIEEQKAQTLLKSGQITHDQLLQIQQVYMDEKYQIEVRAQQKRIRLYQNDPNHDPIALKKLLDQLAQIQQKHSLDMEKLHTQAAAASAAAWQKAFQPITAAFDTTVKGMIMGTTTWQKGMSNILGSVVAEFVNSGVNMAVQWAATEASKTAATVAGTQARTAAEQGASATSIMTSAMTVVKTIMNSAAETFAGIFGFLSPMMGPAAAAPAAAGMGSVAAIAGSVASSAGGDWQIPSDRLNFVHKNETILPADKSAGLDKLISGGGSLAPIHIHGNDQSNFSMDQLKTLLTQMNRNFISLPR